MPADRTTLKAAVQELEDKLRTGLSADPPTASKPFWAVRAGDATTGEYPRPFLAVKLMRARPIAAVDGDRAFAVSMLLRIVTDVTGADVHDALLDKCGAVEDYFDSIVDTGVIDGADGFDARDWKFEYPTGTATGRVATAEAVETFVVKVARGENR
jgi:hypothetical protein